MSGCTARRRTSAQLDHYLELLQRKPGGHGALGRARPGTRPRRVARLLRRALGRADRPLRTLGRGPADGRRRAAHAASTGPAGVELAVRGALTAGAIDGRAVALLARRAQSTERTRA